MAKSDDPPRYYSTRKSVEDSEIDIMRVLRAWGANNIGFGSECAVRFTYDGLPAEIRMPVDAMEKRLKNTGHHAEGQAQRVAYRHMLYYLETVMELINAGAMRPIDLLLPHLLDADGRRLVDVLEPQLDQAALHPGPFATYRFEARALPSGEDE